MQTEDVTRDQDVCVMGLPLRTSPDQAGQDIPALWQRFMQQGWAQKLPRLASDGAIYAVYCDYETDHRGPYTMVLGVAVAADTVATADLRKVTLGKGRYARFVASGDPTQAVWRTWAHVCEAWERRGQRSFTADYERYDPSALARFGSGPIDVEVVVGLR